jgi:hypothetical protein
VGHLGNRIVSPLRTFWFSALAISLFGIVAQISIFRHNLVDLYSFRQTQTAFTIREYMAGNWSVDTPLPTLGPPWTNPYEFPLFQGTAAILGNALGVAADTAGRVTGLLFFLLTGLLLAVLVRRWVGVRASLITLVLFQTTPFAIQWASSSLIEFAATALVLGAIVAIDSYSKNKNWLLLLLSTGLLTLGFTVKVTTAVAWALVFLVAATGLTWQKLPSWRAVVAGLAPLVVAFGAGLLWTRYADAVKEQNPIGRYLTSDALSQWNFGTLLQRTNLDQWDRIFERLPSLGSSLWISVVLMGIALWKLRLDLRLLALASVPVIAVLTFFNLYVVHSYYLSAIYPAYVAILGIGVAAVSALVSQRVISLLIAGVLMTLLVILAWTSTEGRSLAALIGVDGEFPRISLAIADSTPADAGVIVVGCDWDPTPLYYADRRGMTIPPWYYDGVPVEWVGNELTYLAFCGENYSVIDGDPASVLPAGSLSTQVSPGIYRVVGPVDPSLLK